MPYKTISVREALRKINEWDSTTIDGTPGSEGWFLPDIQRQYVWPSRYDADKFICELFDSLYRGFPIGSFLIGKTDLPIAHRRFAVHYTAGDNCPIEDEGTWSRPNKGLVYDGQQRLQTIYSGLLFSLNGKVLCFDLSIIAAGGDDVPFKMVLRTLDDERHPSFVPLNSLFRHSSCEKFSEHMEQECAFVRELEGDQREKCLHSLRRLWSVFAGAEEKSLAYFEAAVTDSSDMQTLFERTNTGGVQLTQIDLLFSRIKNEGGEYIGFEERIIEFCQDKGLSDWFYPDEILRVLLLLIGRGIGVKASGLTSSDFKKLNDCFTEQFRSAVIDFVSAVLRDDLGVPDRRLIVSVRALYPIAALFAKLRRDEDGRREYSNFPSPLKGVVRQYIVMSQLLSWDLQSFVHSAWTLLNTIKILDDGAISVGANSEACISSESLMEELKKLARNGRRFSIQESDFDEKRIFGLTLLTRPVTYNLGSARPRPELDHIFPLTLIDDAKHDRALLDSVWNLQPVPGKKNNEKRGKHPAIWFKENPGTYVLYDGFSKDETFEDPNRFVERRRERLIDKFVTKFGLQVERPSGGDGRVA